MGLMGAVTSKCFSQAWYRRGKVNTSLSNYEDAICDLKVAMDMEETCSGKKQMETDLKLVLDQNKTGNSVRKFGGNKHRIDGKVLATMCTFPCNSFSVAHSIFNYENLPISDNSAECLCNPSLAICTCIFQ